MATKETRETVKETTVAPASPEKSKSKIKKIFGKMKRSNSGYLYEDKNKSRNSANQQNQENSSSNTNNGSRCSEGSRQGPLKKWTEHFQELHLLKIHS